MLGIHIHKGKRDTSCLAIDQDLEFFNINCGQICVINSRSYKKIKLENNINDIKKLIKKNNFKLFVHVSHTTNGFWSDDKKKEISGFNLLLNQMKTAERINADGIVLHLPKRHYKYVSDRIEKYKTNFNKINIDLLLEHPTYKSDENCSYETPSKLNRLTEHIKKIKLKRWGYVIDTAHLWSSITETDRKKGYKIETYQGASKWINDIDNKTKDKIKLIHFNGSHNKHSSNKDKHAIPIFGKYNNKKSKKIETDNIWSKYLDSQMEIKKNSMYKFIEFAKEINIPLIIEMNYGTNDQLLNSLNFIKKLL